MKTPVRFFVTLALCGAAPLALAHEEGQRGGQAGGPQGQGGPGGGGPGGMLANLPVYKAIDKNGDGEFSAEEIAGASAALAALDKDGDGKLTGEEIRPARRQRGESAHDQAHRTIEELDKNKDGKLTADELPARMKAMIERADADKDGAVTEGELIKLIEKDTPPPAPPGGGEGPRPEGAPERPGV